MHISLHDIAICCNLQWNYNCILLHIATKMQCRTLQLVAICNCNLLQLEWNHNDDYCDSLQLSVNLHNGFHCNAITPSPTKNAVQHTPTECNKQRFPLQLHATYYYSHGSHYCMFHPQSFIFKQRGWQGDNFMQLTMCLAPFSISCRYNHWCGSFVAPSSIACVYSPV